MWSINMNKQYQARKKYDRYESKKKLNTVLRHSLICFNKNCPMNVPVYDGDKWSTIKDKKDTTPKVLFQTNISAMRCLNIKTTSRSEMKGCLFMFFVLYNLLHCFLNDETCDFDCLSLSLLTKGSDAISQSPHLSADIQLSTIYCRN